MKLFSPPHGKLKFGIPSREVNFERNQGKPFLIGLYRDLPDLLAIQKQSSWPNWINVKAVCCLVWAYVKVVEPQPLVVGVAKVPNVNVGSTTAMVSVASSGAFISMTRDIDEADDVRG